MASRKPITQANGVLEQLQTSVDTLTVGDYDLPNTISTDGKVLVTVAGAATWEYASHADLSNITVDDHHPKSHVHTGDGSGTVEHGSTANITVDNHHDQTHTHNGTDSSGVVEHDDTANITVDQHHDQSHTHNGADSSGVVEHDDTANGTIANHDTSATGTELDTLTDGSNADTLHVHAGVGTSGNVTYYIATTGNDSTGDGTSGDPWETIPRALDEMSLNSFEANAVVTISLASGTYLFYEVVVDRTPAPHIVIQGEAPTKHIISATSVTFDLGGGQWDVTFVVNTTTGISVGDYFSIVGGGAGVYNGAWEVQDVPDSTHVKVRVISHRITLAPGSPSGAGYVAPTMLQTMDGAGFSIRQAHIQLTDLTLFPDTPGVGVDGIRVYDGWDVLIGPFVSCAGYTSGFGFLMVGGSCDTDTLLISTCSIGGRVTAGGSMRCVDSTFNGNGQGLQAIGGVITLRGDQCYASSNATNGLVAFELGSIDAQDTTVFGNVLGVYAARESYARVTAAEGNTFGFNATDYSPGANSEGNQNSYMVG